MIEVEIAVEESGAVVQTIAHKFAPEQKIEEVARFIADKIGSSLDEVLADLYENDQSLEKDVKIGNCAKHIHRWRLKRVCISLHFESESVQHQFPARAKWEQVHKWGVKHFNIASDVSANLELHRETPTGLLLNEKTVIGHFQGCQDVWLVKPGPENNG